MTLADLELKAEKLDREDALAKFRDAFKLDPNIIYLDGNSLGPMLKSIPERIVYTLEDEWAGGLIRSWNDADWINLPERVGERVAPLIGAKLRCVTVTDSTSVNIFKVLSAALMLNKSRKVIISEKGNFPTDIYLAEGLRDFLNQDYIVRLAETDDEIISFISEETAVILLTHVDFRTGRMLDMEKITKAAHEKGALVIWDLAHSAGAMPVHLDKVDADFAIGCGYKYLNGGPGAPSFIYANEKHLGEAWQPLTGWFSHKSPFAFDQVYEPDKSIKQFLCGTPPVLSMVALDEALKIWNTIDIQLIRVKSLMLSDFFLECVEAAGLRKAFVSVTPMDHDRRGSQISLQYNGDGYAIMQCLISKGVIGDFRKPGILRFGFAPLYNSFDEVFRAVSILQMIMQSGEWNAPEFQTRKAVT